MIGAIIKGIFNLVLSLFDALLAPIIGAITALFPNLGDMFTHLSVFLTMCFTYVRSILKLLLIDDIMITTLFDYFLICYSIYLIVLGIRFGINVYNKFKI